MIAASQPNWSDLRPGDCLGYFSRDLIDYAIALKTWTRLAHVEIYEGNGLSVASRNGLGVNRYPLRKTDIAVIRRPFGGMDFESAKSWFETTARGEKYDWKGLLCFTLAVRQGSMNRMYCSEFMLRWYRAAGFLALDPDWDADKTPPAFILVPPTFETMWKAPGWAR
jgi:hypothetical protein